MAGEGLAETEGMEEEVSEIGRGTTTGTGIWMGSEGAGTEMGGTGSRVVGDSLICGLISRHWVFVVYCEYS